MSYETSTRYISSEEIEANRRKQEAAETKAKHDKEMAGMFQYVGMENLNKKRKRR